MFSGTGTLFIWLIGATFLFLLLVVAMGGHAAILRMLRGETPDGSNDDAEAIPQSGGMPGTPSDPLDKKAHRSLLKEQKKRKLRERLMQSGFYGTAAGPLFMVFRMVLILGAAGLGFLISLFGNLELKHGILIGTVCGIVATIGPGFWLDRRKRGRQNVLRAAFPDAMDILIVCLQGGLSVMASIARVASELSMAHPSLAVEFKIAERQMQLGQSAADAIRGIAERFDLPELRGMAATINQAERVGASIATALEVFAETLREKRSQQAQEAGAKAVVKMLFPTVFFIMPAMFVVILGPAAIMVYENLVTKG